MSTRLDECSLFLTTGGIDPAGTHEDQLNSLQNQTTTLRHHQVRKLTSLAIQTYGDLLEQTETSSRWSDTGLLGVNFLDHLLEPRIPEHRQVSLRPGSCWT